MLILPIEAKYIKAHKGILPKKNDIKDMGLSSIYLNII
jgi:hypothetical protein